jgi:hypothetical protein
MAAAAGASSSWHARLSRQPVSPGQHLLRTPPLTHARAHAAGRPRWRGAQRAPLGRGAAGGARARGEERPARRSRGRKCTAVCQESNFRARAPASAAGRRSGCDGCDGARAGVGQPVTRARGAGAAAGKGPLQAGIPRLRMEMWRWVAPDRRKRQTQGVSRTVTCVAGSTAPAGPAGGRVPPAPPATGARRTAGGMAVGAKPPQSSGVGPNDVALRGGGTGVRLVSRAQQQRARARLQPAARRAATRRAGAAAPAWAQMAGGGLFSTVSNNHARALWRQAILQAGRRAGGLIFSTKRMRP